MDQKNKNLLNEEDEAAVAEGGCAEELRLEPKTNTPLQPAATCIQDLPTIDGKYAIEGILGRGAQSEVYLAQDL